MSLFLALTTSALAVPFEKNTVSVEASALAMPGDATWTGGVAMAGEDNGFLSVDWRSMASGDTVGRATAGFDVFPRKERFDLTLGMSLGGAGDWRDRAVYGQLGAGLELGLGFNIKDFHLNYRRVQPFVDSPACRGLDEKEWRAGYDINDSLSVFGTSLRIHPDLDEDAQTRAYGFGASLTF